MQEWHGLVLMAVVSMFMVGFVMWAAARVLRDNSRSEARENNLVASMAMQILEKVSANPGFVASLHSRERMHLANLETSLEREEIRRQSPPPPEAPPADPDGVETDNPDDARYQ